ncbi:MAG: biotin transporter BioY [Planctomycetes bacterium]|nr:biotin transporter BioY [Planctomycetota bacterium]
MELVRQPTVVGSRRIWMQAAGVVGFALLTTAAAQIRFYLPDSPVPVTMQTLFVLLAGMTLGARLGTASMAFYLLLGACGYHVFAGPTWQAAYLIGPTGGYLLGFVLAQPVIGWLAHRDERWTGMLAASLVGSAIIFVAGLLWLQLWTQTAVAQTLTMGLWPFIPGLAIKTAAAFAGGLALRPVSRRFFVGPPRP